MVDELHHHRLHQARRSDGKLDTLQHRIYGFDPQGENPLMHAYIVADVPLDVTEAPPAKPEPQP